MAARTDRPTAGPLVCFVGPLSDRDASAMLRVEPSCEDLDQIDRSPREDRDTVYSGRIPRFAYVTQHREGPPGRTDSPHGFPPPMKTPVMGRSSEEGVK